VERAAGQDNTSYRPVRAIGMLLVLQVAGIAAVGAYEFWQVLSRVDWERVRLGDLPPGTTEAAAFALFLPPAVLMLVSAMSFFILRRRGWILAAFSQGLSLAVCLWLYAEFGPYYVYPIMAYCILMILYLNSHDVRVVFHVVREPEKRGGLK
jgi:hypothetical protein